MAGRRAAVALTRALLGAVLLAAGALKAMDPSLAVMAVGAYGLLPPKAALAVGFLLPGVEIAVGAALLTGFLVRGAAILGALLSAMFSKRDNDTWFQLLTQAEVPCAPVQTIDQVFHAPQVLHRKMLLDVDHPTAGKIRMAGIPVKFSDTPAAVRNPPPLLGQHNEEVLRNWLGMSAAAIEELKKEKII